MSNLDILLSLFTKAEATLATIHTFTIGSVVGRGFAGYWFNSIGSIQSGTYTLSTGSSVTIRQCMVTDNVNNADLIFVLFGGGLSANAASLALFPQQVVVSRAGNSITYERGSSASTVGQGIRVDYSPVGGATALEARAVFGTGTSVTVNVELKG